MSDFEHPSTDVNGQTQLELPVELQSQLIHDAQTEENAATPTLVMRETDMAHEVQVRTVKPLLAGIATIAVGAALKEPYVALAGGVVLFGSGTANVTAGCIANESRLRNKKRSF